MNADIGLIGLAVMGQNLVLNMCDHGYTVAVYNRTTQKMRDFVNSDAAKGKKIIACETLADLVKAIRPPRPIMFMVKAGAAVDEQIEQLLPLIAKGDILIDGGNSHFADTIRRNNYLKEKGILFIGTGVSGGEEGARHGPAIMPGGQREAYERVKDIFLAIAAKVGPKQEPCCAYIGDDGAGHFVKMVHNGIEYGDMQMIAEIYGLLRDGAGLEAAEIGEVFAAWNRGRLN
ncbi:MAG: NAD(P)-binding domain-containing protein, partial [Planctomycetota bacterium]|nr:NAD(P)-binding domain-containing protein [Planctomycetota bacterium]